MHACTIVLAFVGLVQAAPVHRRSGDVVSALTTNALNPTAEGVDALGGQTSTIVGQVAGPDDSDSITAFLSDTSIPATQEGVEILTGALDSRSSDNVVSALTANALNPTAEGVDALGGQASTIVGQVAGPDDSDSITAFLSDTSIPATQEGVDILTGALDSRSADNVVSELTANALNPTAEGVDALGGQSSTIVGQVAGSDSDDSITSFLADTSIPATQEGVDILTGAVSE